MAGKDITQVRIGQYSFGIIGIQRLMEEMAASHAQRSDAEVQAVMLERLSSNNYIPAKARNDYGKAFVRAFRKFLGQPCCDDAPRGLDIKVLGPGCNQCRGLEQTLMDVLTEIQLAASVEHVTDLKAIARYGVMGTPALVINGKIVSVGSVPPRSKLKAMLLQADAPQGAKGK
jgi:hypothetical protein